ncbi:MAG: hypothetical protein KDK66_00365 [Deltaproteobacteria bacterium]|nr:hypothetical protein [Deltaproteobacteria bacterium]
MKTWFIFFSLLMLPFSLKAAPVYSANGFICGGQGKTVTCKGPIPGRPDESMTATGHNVVYMTINTKLNGAMVRYTYFSDTGCLVGYTFNAAGEPALAVAYHRESTEAHPKKKTFDFSKNQYESLAKFCEEPFNKNP